MKKEKESLIYVLTNEDYADNCLKIGYTTDLKARLNNLNTSLLHDFKVFVTYDVPRLQGHMSDKLFHNLLENIDPSIRYNKKKEFFYLYPEQAYEILKDMAMIHDRIDCLHLYGKLEKREKPLTEVTSKKQIKENLNNTYYSKNKKAKLLYKKETKSFIVLKGSEVQLASNEEAYKYFKKQQDDLINSSGIIQNQDGEWVTNIDLTFKSPSGAANFVNGVSTNGTLFWKNSDGITIKQAMDEEPEKL